MTMAYNWMQQEPIDIRTREEDIDKTRPSRANKIADLDLPSLDPEQMTKHERLRLSRHALEERREIEAASKDLWE